MHNWTRDEIRRIGYRVVDLIADHLSTLPDEPVFRPVPPELAQAFLAAPPPQDPVSPDEILRRCFRDASSRTRSATATRASGAG